MTTFFYSSSTGGFYRSDIHVNQLPADAVGITAEQYTALLEAQSTGIAITSDSNGAPVAIPPAAPTAAALLATAQGTQTQTLKSACAATIIGGFTSTALGTSAAYGSQQTDQSNLLSVVASTAGGSLWCQEPGSEWSFVDHTAAQALKVLADWQTFRTAQQSKYASLVAQVNGATTVEAVQSITW